MVSNKLIIKLVVLTCCNFEVLLSCMHMYVNTLYSYKYSVHTGMYVCMTLYCMYGHIYTHTHTSTHTYSHMCTHVQIYTCTVVHTPNTPTPTHVHKFIYACAHIHVEIPYTYMHMYVRTHTRIHTHTHTHTHTHFINSYTLPNNTTVVESSSHNTILQIICMINIPTISHFSKKIPPIIPAIKKYKNSHNSSFYTQNYHHHPAYPVPLINNGGWGLERWLWLPLGSASTLIQLWTMTIRQCLIVWTSLPGACIPLSEDQRRQRHRWESSSWIIHQQLLLF